MKPVYVSKYEATMHMKRHIRVTKETEPSYSTRRWREPEASHKFPKQTGQQEQIDKKIKEENLLLSRKMYEVATEDRVNRTSEYAPGWRTGICKYHSLLKLLVTVYHLTFPLLTLHRWNGDRLLSNC